MRPAAFFPAAAILIVAMIVPSVVLAEDVVVLKSGAKQAGRIVSQDNNVVVLEMQVGKRKVTRKFPRGVILSITSDDASDKPSGNGSPAAAASRANVADDDPADGVAPMNPLARSQGSRGSSSARRGDIPQRSKAEVLELIQTVGRTPPDWYESTPLDYPPTLDLAWPEKPPGGWDASKNVGQYIWDRINPNPGKWREGVRLMHHIMSQSEGDRGVTQRAMRALGTMYHNLHEDYARAAFWWQQAGIDANPEQERNAAVQLAHCYHQLGNSQMGLDVLKRMSNYPPSVIKVLGDMGQTDDALRFADRLAQLGQKVQACLYAGDVCRVASRLDQAEKYYRQALAAASQDERNNDHSRRDRQRAEASIAAIRFYQIAPDKVADGTYRASSLGYEDQVEVAVTVRSGRIEDVKITKHREKQFYSSLTDTPRAIVTRQGVVGVDTTSGATITSEAIINATAKALSEGASSRPSED